MFGKLNRAIKNTKKSFKYVKICNLQIGQNIKLQKGSENRFLCFGDRLLFLMDMVFNKGKTVYFTNKEEDIEFIHSLDELVDIFTDEDLSNDDFVSIIINSKASNIIINTDSNEYDVLIQELLEQDTYINIVYDFNRWQHQRPINSNVFIFAADDDYKNTLSEIIKRTGERETKIYYSFNGIIEYGEHNILFVKAVEKLHGNTNKALELSKKIKPTSNPKNGKLLVFLKNRGTFYADNVKYMPQKEKVSIISKLLPF